ncbi:hypothetical protein ACLB2K_038323 [Fragaria x ananassa]
MENRGMAPSKVTYTIVIDALVRYDDMERAFHVFSSKQKSERLAEEFEKQLEKRLVKRVSLRAGEGLRSETERPPVGGFWGGGKGGREELKWVGDDEEVVSLGWLRSGEWPAEEEGSWSQSCSGGEGVGGGGGGEKKDKNGSGREKTSLRGKGLYKRKKEEQEQGVKPRVLGWEFVRHWLRGGS